MPESKSKQGESSGDEKRKRPATPDDESSEGSRKSRRKKNKVKLIIYTLFVEFTTQNSFILNIK